MINDEEEVIVVKVTGGEKMIWVRREGREKDYKDG